MENRNNFFNLKKFNSYLLEWNDIKIDLLDCFIKWYTLESKKFEDLDSNTKLRLISFLNEKFLLYKSKNKFYFAEFVVSSFFQKKDMNLFEHQFF